jgi:hypothetical protein
MTEHKLAIEILTESPIFWQQSLSEQLDEVRELAQVIDELDELEGIDEISFE